MVYLQCAHMATDSAVISVGCDRQQIRIGQKRDHRFDWFGRIPRDLNAIAEPFDRHGYFLRKLCVYFAAADTARK